MLYVNGLAQAGLAFAMGYWAWCKYRNEFSRAGDVSLRFAKIFSKMYQVQWLDPLPTLSTCRQFSRNRSEAETLFAMFVNHMHFTPFN